MDIICLYLPATYIWLTLSLASVLTPASSKVPKMATSGPHAWCMISMSAVLPFYHASNPWIKPSTYSGQVFKDCGGKEKIYEEIDSWRGDRAYEVCKKNDTFMASYLRLWVIRSCDLMRVSILTSLVASLSAPAPRRSFTKEAWPREHAAMMSAVLPSCHNAVER